MTPAVTTEVRPCTPPPTPAAPPAVCLLLDRGAGVEARDTTWDSTPMEWAAIGSGEQPASHPHPAWTGTVQALLDAGASARGHHPVTR